jgi:hypothetical protein
LAAILLRPRRRPSGTEAEVEASTAAAVVVYSAAALNLGVRTQCAFG